jgi:hypothetical protein
MTVQPRRRKPRREYEDIPQGIPKSGGVDGQEKLSGKLYGDRTGNRHRWVRRVASGERVRRGQGTRHTDPVTSEEGMPMGVATLAVVALVGRSESAQATV